MMMECAKTGRLKKEGGFTLVELIIALTLLLLISLAFIPMFVYITEASQSNKARLVALKLASSKIEEIRALPYDEVGTVGGNPQGVIPQTETKPIEGINYIIETQIGWVNDPSDDDAGGSDPLPYDYKSVKVKVTAPSAFTGEVVKTIDTLVAEEGEERVYPGGNINVKVQRAWYAPGNQPEAVEGVKIEVAKKDGTGTVQTGWTVDNGEALFAALEEGEYVVQADAGIQGMMVHPDQAAEEVTVVKGTTQPCIINVEYPAHLEINLVNAATGAAIASTNGVLRLSTLNASVPTEEVDFNSDANGVISSGTIGDLWPAFGDVYEVEVFADGYFPYRLQKDINQEWDGSFNAPKEKRSITVKLIPAANNANVTVVDDGDSPVAGASVRIFEHEFVYQRGSWKLSSTGLVYSRVTDAVGSVSVALWDSKGKPFAPNEGDTYTIYGVSVAKDGYHDFAKNEAFWISEGKQMDGTGEIDAYQVNLDPYLGAIRVEVFERFIWTYPVEGASVKVTGPNSYEKTLQTNSKGEAVFTGLSFGEYDVVVSHRGASQTWHVMISEEKEYYKRFDFN